MYRRIAMFILATKEDMYTAERTFSEIVVLVVILVVMYH
jgi:hypothetical protein